MIPEWQNVESGIIYVMLERSELDKLTSTLRDLIDAMYQDTDNYDLLNQAEETAIGLIQKYYPEYAKPA